MKKILALVLVALSCYGERAILNTFNAGELSPHMDARIDFEKYTSGQRTFENFICLPYGGALKRPGTQFIEETKNNGVARLAPFSVGVDQTYVMEMGHEYIRFYQDGIQLTNELTSVYTSNDVFEVQMAQFADTVYLAHPDHPPQKLQRTSTTPEFTIAAVDFYWPPTLDENITDITISANDTTGTVTLTASEALFTEDHQGSTWVLRTPHEDNTVTTISTSDPIRVEGEWSLLTKAVEEPETVTIEVSEDDGDTWGVYRKYIGTASPGVIYDRAGEETEVGILYRIVSSGPSATLTAESPYINGTVTIATNGFGSATSVTGTVDVALGSTNATVQWYEGAFSDQRGYPKTVEFFENRLWFAGTEYQVNTVWGSVTDDYENYQITDYDDSSLRLSLNSDNVIQWMLGRNQLFIGTLGDEWLLSGGDSSTPITPTSLLARRQTGFGSREGISALIASDSIMYLQRQGRKMRELEYSFEADQYRSSDVTMIAEHITESGIIQFVEQQQPEPIIWAVRGDGELIGMTYSKQQNVYGWHRHITDGEFESVAVLPTLGEDRVYVVVRRVINGETKRYVEWFRPYDWGDDDDDAWFVDSGLDWDGGASIDVDDFLIGTNWFMQGSDFTDYDGDYVWYDTDGKGAYRYTQTNNLASLKYFEYNSTQGRWDILLEPEVFGYEIYSSATTNTTLPPTTNWTYASVTTNYNFGSQFYGGVDDGDEVILYATINTNALKDGDFIRIDNDSDVIIGFDSDNPFMVTNVTATNLTLLYEDGTSVRAYGDYTGGMSFYEVKKSFTNVSHLAGETLDVFADGGAAPDATVATNGVLTLTEYYNYVIAGLPYTARLCPMYIDIVNQSMVSYARYKNPYKVHMRLNNSGQFNYGSSEDNLFPVSVRLPGLTAGSPVPFYSGDRGLFSVDTPANSQPEIWITSDQPLPLELLSLTIFSDVKEYE